MENLILKNLKTKDKMLIIKAIVDITKQFYDDNKTSILTQLLKTDNKQFNSDFGLFTTRTTKGKTAQEVIEANNEKILKLRIENSALEKLDKNAIVEESTTILVSKHSAYADKLALELLEDVINEFQMKRLEKSASKIASKK